MVAASASASTSSDSAGARIGVVKHRGSTLQRADRRSGIMCSGQEYLHVRWMIDRGADDERR
jgi:hypothetical protein